MAFEPVGVMLECFAASSGGRKVALNLCGHTGVAWALTLLHAQEWKHLRSDRRGGWAMGCPVYAPACPHAISPLPLETLSGVPEPGASGEMCLGQPGTC